jgi:Zn-dependent protease with chaperone function
MTVRHRKGVMRGLWVVLMWACSQAAMAEGIATVLDRSQQVRLAQRPAAAAHSDAAQRVRASLQRLSALPASGHSEPVELVLVGGGLFAEALLDRAGIAVSEPVGDLPEGERLLLLAHELGHVRLGHAPALKALYRRHIPGDVRPETTDPVAAALGADARALSHRHELEADAYAYALVRGLGFGLDDALGLLTRQGLQRDSATHPGTHRRIAQLRALEVRLVERPVQSADVHALALAWVADH